MDDAMTSTADTVPPDDSIEPRGTLLATLGFLMAAAGPILLILAGLLFGLDTEDLTFFIVPSVLGLLGAYLVRRRSTVAKGVAILLAVIIVLMVFWTVFGLFAPASFFDFVPGTLVLPGALLAVGATIASLRSSKRGISSGSGERRTAFAVLAVIGVLTGLSAVLTVAGRETVPDALAAEADLVVNLSDFEFDEDAYEVPGGGTVLVKNDDPFLHTFTVDELDIDEDFGPGSEKLIAIPAEAGTYVLYCEPHTSDPDDPSEDDMASELTVG
jgi:plastocyanin